MSDTRLIDEVRRYPPDAIFPYPWKVEPSPQVDETLGWSVLDADDTEIFTVHDEEVANALAAVPQFIARVEELERSSLAYAERRTSDAARVAALEEAADEVVRTRYEPGSWGHEAALNGLNKLLPKPYTATGPRE